MGPEKVQNKKNFVIKSWQSNDISKSNGTMLLYEGYKWITPTWVMLITYFLNQLRDRETLEGSYDKGSAKEAGGGVTHKCYGANEGSRGVML